MQWILESPPLSSFAMVTPWLQDIYATMVELDGHKYAVENIEQFYVHELSSGYFIVVVKVHLEPMWGDMLVYEAESEMEDNLDDRLN